MIGAQDVAYAAPLEYITNPIGPDNATPLWQVAVRKADKSAIDRH